MPTSKWQGTSFERWVSFVCPADRHLLKVPLVLDSIDL